MTLEQRLLHINRNKMNIWNCIVNYIRPNALKSSHFSHSKCYKNDVYEENDLKLGTKFFIGSSNTYIPVF